jgi:hypothetical protein
LERGEGRGSNLTWKVQGLACLFEGARATDEKYMAPTPNTSGGAPIKGCLIVVPCRRFLTSSRSQLVWITPRERSALWGGGGRWGVSSRSRSRPWSCLEIQCIHHGQSNTLLLISARLSLGKKKLSRPWKCLVRTGAYMSVFLSPSTVIPQRFSSWNLPLYTYTKGH